MPKPREVTASDIRSVLTAPGEEVLLHRFWHVGEHIEDRSCWCSPMPWSFADARRMNLREMQRHLNEFYCVH